jgi:SAM-dependent methyltransferase
MALERASASQPPTHLMNRVGGNTDVSAYRQVGAEAAQELMKAVTAAHAGLVRDLLDWGCGPGRVAVHILRDYPGIGFRGCDIDTEAIAWANQHIAPGRFDATPLYPPLPYPDGSFDAVLACSVMTHLQRRMQTRWLREIARILRPDGIFAATVHGRTAAASFGHPDLHGIQDHYLDMALAGIVPDGYYHGVIQDETYTRVAWSERFNIIAWREAAVGLQDIVACRVKGVRQHAATSGA